MAPNLQNLKPLFNFSVLPGSSSTSRSIEINGPEAFNGVLLYVASRSEPTKKVGKFIIPAGMQDNSPICTDSEFPESSVTHTKGQTYQVPFKIDYELPASMPQDDLVLHAVIVIKTPEGYKWGVFEEATVVKMGGNMQMDKTMMESMMNDGMMMTMSSKYFPDVAVQTASMPMTETMMMMPTPMPMNKGKKNKGAVPTIIAMTSSCMTSALTCSPSMITHTKTETKTETMPVVTVTVYKMTTCTASAEAAAPSQAVEFKAKNNDQFLQNDSPAPSKEAKKVYEAEVSPPEGAMKMPDVEAFNDSEPPSENLYERLSSN